MSWPSLCTAGWYQGGSCGYRSGKGHLSKVMECIDIDFISSCMMEFVIIAQGKVIHPGHTMTLTKLLYPMSLPSLPSDQPFTHFLTIDSACDAVSLRVFRRTINMNLFQAVSLQPSFAHQS
jgi:hypothetical protein